MPYATLLALLAACLLASSGVAAEFAPPDPPANIDTFGRHIQRTMTLLATSTPQKRNRVRVLFYGQSVTRNPWWRDMADYLRKTYPHADLEIANLAIGGYTAPTLIDTAEYDLYPFYPDLLIFHVYGGVRGGEQEAIIRRTRERTTSEVLLWTSHFRWPRDLPRDGSPDDPAAQRLTRADEARTQMVRAIAKNYGCELAEVREPFRAYLKKHGLYPKDTLRDSVHPNALGNFLIGRLMIPYLRYDPKFPQDPWKDLVQDIPLGDPRVTRGADGSIELKFDGNRVDVVAAHGRQGKLGSARVLIDGKAPSEFPELYYHTKPSLAPYDGIRPAINRMSNEKPLVVEKWTARILACDPEKNVLKYEVEGSKTGPDGQGDHLKTFVSNSGRVVIPARKWMVCWALKYRKKPLPKGFKVTWETKLLGADVYRAPKTEDAAALGDTLLAQGLANTEHTLKLVPNGDGALAVQAIRVYRPPLR